MRTVMIGDRRFHLPFLDLIPFDEKQDADLGADIQEHGVILPVVCWKEKKTSSEDTVVDGAHRIIWAAKHGLGSIPKSYRSFDSDEDAKEECERLNYERRHLSVAYLQKCREDRIERIAERRRQGESLRAIAEAEGVSVTQVTRDLEAPGVPGGTPETENGEIIGKDGKSYKSGEQKPLCERCERVGAVQGCPACQKLAEKAEKRKKKKKKKPARDPLHDAFKNVIPDKLRAAWGDPWIGQTIDFLAEFSEKFRKERIADGLNKRAKHYPFYNAKDVIDGVGFVIHYLDDLLTHFKEMRPAGVCPNCSGEGCAKCKGGGLVPRTVYKELKAK